MADQNFRVKRGLEVGIGGTVLTATPTGNVSVGTAITMYSATGTVSATKFDGDLNALGKTYYVSTTGSDSNSGNNINEPFLTVEHALSVSTNGDIINISAGTYEETCPLTVPRGVTVKGSGLRATTIRPTDATKTNNIFLLNDISTVEDFTITGSYFNSSADTGYSFAYSPGIAITTRSPYIQRVTVLNRGSTVTIDDPYGYDTADSPPSFYIAGAGAKVDGSLVASNSLEAGMLFNEVTFFTPNNKGITLTNGARAEYLNCFHYFASQAIVGTSGTVGIAGTANVRLKFTGINTSPVANDVVKLYENGSVVAVGTITSYDDPYARINSKGSGTFSSAVGIGSTQDVRFYESDGTTQTGIASAISLADYTMFGAEMRSVGCAVEYGSQGVVADGAGVQLRLFATNFNHVGTGKDFTNDPTIVVQANEVVESNGGQVSYVSIDQGGDFRVGDALYINQQTGNVSFAATTYDLEVLGNLDITDGVSNTTTITPTSLSVGDLQLASNNLTSTSGDIDIDPAGSGEVNIYANVNVVGILTASVIEVSALQKGDTSIAIDDTGSDGTIRFNTDNVEAMRISSSQNIGVGTDDPQSKLDVGGRLTVDEAIIEDLTNDRIVITGVGGRLEDSANLTFDGSTLNVTGQTEVDDINVTGISTFVGTTEFKNTIDVDGHTELDELNVAGVSTFASNVDINAAVDISNTLTVDGHTELDELNVAGVSTFASNVDINASIDVDGHTELDELNVAGVSTFASDIDVNASIDISNTLTVDGHTELDELNVVGVSTFASNIDVNAAIDIDGHTELDELNVVGVSTFGSDLDINAAVDISNTLTVDGHTELDELNVVGVSTFGSDLDINAAVDISNTLTVDGHTELDELNVTGVSTFASNVDINAGLDVDGHTELDELNVSGVATFASNVNISAGELHGPAEFIIDPAGVGDNTGLVRIKGDLYVDGTEFKVNSETITLADYKVGIATTVGTNLLLDGAGIGIGSDNIEKTFTYNNSADTLESSVGLGVTSGGSFKAGTDSVLTRTSLGPTVVSSSLTSVGTLNELNVAGVSTFASNVDINASIDVDGHTELDELNVAGVSTFASDVDINANVDISGYLDVDGFAELDGVNISETLNVAGVSTFASDVDVNASLDISVNLNVSGIGTISTIDATNATIDNLTFTSGTAITSVDTDLNTVSGSDDTLASAKAIKTYVDAQVTAQDLDFAGDSGTGAVDLDSQTFTISGTANEIETSASSQTITIGLPNQIEVSNSLTIGSATTITGSGIIAGIVTGTLDNTLTLATSGTGLSGSATYDNSSGSTFTVTSNATDVNTGGTIVARDGSGNFSAGTITADLTGVAADATKLETAREFSISGDATSTSLTFDGTGNVGLAVTLATVNGDVGSYGSSTEIPVVTVNAKGLVTSVTTASVGTALTVAGDSGSEDINLLTETLTISGGTNLTSSAAANGVTLDLDSSIDLTSVNATGIITASQFVTGVSGEAIGINTNTISGPSTITLDPAGVGDNTGTVVIKGDLQIDGTTTTVNSTTVTVNDKNIELADGAANDAAADGGGITVQSGEGNKTFQFEATGDNFGSSENMNLASGKVYKINNAEVLSANSLTISNVSASGIGTFSGGVVADVTGNVTGNADTATSLETARDFQITGDATSTSLAFDGTGNVGLAVTLATVNGDVGSYGSSTEIPVVTVNAKGLVTAVTTASVGTALTVAGDSGSELIDLLTESLTISGGTNLTSSAASDTITINLDDNISLTSVVASGVITATSGFVGDLTGNSDTATSLETSRDFSISGDVSTGSAVSFDGTGNVDLEVVLSSTFSANTSGIITASSFVGSLTGTATTATNLEDAANITTGTINDDRLPDLITSNINIASGVSTVSTLDVTNATIDNLTFTSGTAITSVDTDLTTVSGSDDTLASAKAIKSYIDTQVGGAGGALNYNSDSGSGTINLATQSLTVAGTANEIETVGAGLTITIGLPDEISVNSSLTIGSGTTITGSGIIAGIVTGTLDNTLTLATSGTGLSGSTTYDNSGASTFTVTSNATDANTGGTIVARDGSGNFSASTITANLTGTATTATKLETARDFSISGDVATASPVSFNGTGNVDLEVTLSSTFSANTLGIITASSFVGNLTGTATTATNLEDAANITTGTIDSARLTGTYAIDISGNAATATYATSAGIATYATTAGIATYASVSGLSTALQNARDFSISGDVATGSAVSFNGTGNVDLEVALSSTFSANTSGIVTASQLSTGDSGTGINVTTNTISGPSELIIDPAGVGDDTGLVRIRGDLFVDGTQTVINSSTLEISDFIVGIASTATTDILADGAGIQIGPDNTLLYDHNNTALKSSENFNIASGKTYKIDGTDVLSSTTLGTNVINSSLTSVGTLTNLSVGDINSTGIVTGSSFVKSGGTSSQFLKADGSVDSSTYASESYVGLATAGLASESYVGLSTAGLASESYVGLATAGLASESYVDTQVGLATAGLTTEIVGIDTTGTSFFSQLNVSGVSTFQSNTTFQGNAYFGDNDVIYLGNSNDLEIRHNGTHSYIKDTGEGHLYFQTNNNLVSGQPGFIFEKTDGTDLAVFNVNSGIDLYHNGNLKFQTTGYGVTVSGGLIVSGVSTFVGVGTFQSDLYVDGDINFTGDLYQNGSIFSGGIVGIDTTGTSFFSQLNVSGVSTLGNTIVGSATTELVVNGDARITGILTIGTSSLTLDGSENQINVGTGVTIHHTNGVQVGENTLHSSGLSLNQLTLTGVSTFQDNVNIGTGSNLTAKLTVGNIENTGVANKGGAAFKTLYSDGGAGESAIFIEEQNGSEGWYLKVSSPGNLIFNYAGVSDRVTFQDTGNVGIGSTQPTEALDVIGNVNVSGIITATTLHVEGQTQLSRVAITTTSTDLVMEAGKTYVYYVGISSLTLPTSPVVGDNLKVINRSGITTAIIARNGSNIMGVDDDVLFDEINGTYNFLYVNDPDGWILTK